MFETKIIIKIKGRNIEKFIKRLNTNNIEIYDLKYLKYNEIIIKIKKEDYELLDKIKTIYELEIIDIKGYDKFKIILKKNKYFLISISISLIILYILCQTIFSIEVIHNNPNLRKIILEELEQAGIKKYHFKKNYSELTKIKEKILKNHKDIIEWLEIKNEGTKYIVRVEERIKNKKEKNNNIRNIVSKKDALILKVENLNGIILKNKNSYVHKGDVIISGSIDLNGEIKKNITANGKVFGEVWYKAIIEYPLNYKEVKMLKKRNKLLVIHLFDKEIELSFKHFKTKKIKSKKLFKHLFLPIYLSFEEQIETKEIEEKLTKEEATNKALDKIIEQFNKKLKKEEYIIRTKKLKVEQNNSKIVLEAFITVCENITDYEDIKEEIKE